MSLVVQFPYHDRNPSTAGFDLLPDLPILLRSSPHVLSGLALVDSGSGGFQDRAFSNSDQARPCQ